MTTGSYNFGSFTTNVPSGSFLGYKGLKSWSGADQPKVAKTPNESYVVYRELWNKKKREYVLTKLHFRKKGYRPKRSKWKEPHAYSMVYQRLEHAPLTWPDGRIFPDWWAVSSYLSDWSVVNLLDNNDQIKLVDRLVGQLRGSDFNMSVFLGESHQTLKMLGDTAIRVVKAVRHVRRGDVTGAARSLFEGTSRKPLAKHDWVTNKPGVASAKNAANLWLELQYGWLPLLKDVEGAAQTLAHTLNVPFRKRYSASVRRESNVPTNTADLGQSVRAVFGVAKSHKRKLIAYITEDPAQNTVAALGILDPELVAWELTPFSFVADWFIPIGQWMETRAQASRLTGTFVTSDLRYALTHSLSFIGATYNEANTHYAQKTLNRTVSTTLTVPMPNFKSFDKAASWRHCANAVALATQMFSTKR